MPKLSLQRKQALARRALCAHLKQKIEDWQNLGELMFSQELPEQYDGLLYEYYCLTTPVIERVSIDEIDGQERMKVVFSAQWEIKAALKEMEVQLILTQEADGRPVAKVCPQKEM